jgi:hypothetical protein
MEKARRTDFVKTINSQYSAFCKSREITPTQRGFAEYIVNRNLITDLTIKRFLVVDKYPSALDGSLGIKRSAMWSLEDLLNISFSSIEVYLRRHIKDFKHENRLIAKS